MENKAPEIPTPGEYIADYFTVNGLRPVRVTVAACSRHAFRPVCAQVDGTCYHDDFFTNYRKVEA